MTTGTEPTLPTDPDKCRHGFDKRMVHCAECADPAFHAAKGPPLDFINGMAMLSAPAAAAMAMTERYTADHEVLVAALKRSLNWLSSYPGGGAEGAYMEVVNALKRVGRYD